MQPWLLIVSIVPTILMGASTTGLAPAVRPASILHHGLSLAGDSRSLDSTCQFIGQCVVYRFRHRKARNQCGTSTCFFLLLPQHSPAMANIKLSCTVGPGPWQSLTELRFVQYSVLLASQDEGQRRCRCFVRAMGCQHRSCSRSHCRHHLRL